MQSEARSDGELHGLPAKYRQRARQSQTHRAHGGIGRRAKLDRATAKYLGLCAELHVYFEPDDRLVFGQNVLGGSGHFPIVALTLPLIARDFL